MLAGTIYLIEKLRTLTVGGSRPSTISIISGKSISAQRLYSTFLLALSLNNSLLILIHCGPLIFLLIISNYKAE
jgi:hypothetical protein